MNVTTTLTEKLLSFSLVLETENLANADLDGLSQSLASLAQQDVPLTAANEVLMIDSGNTSTELLEQLCDRYPWLKIHQAPFTTGYYKAKMLGAAQSTGEIVVYGDSDCTYEAGWLRSLLTPFTHSNDIHSDDIQGNDIQGNAIQGNAIHSNAIHSNAIHSNAIQIVAGETMTRGVGVYGTAMALTYIFPQYSGETALAPTSQYFLNNVAFRREFLLQHPIPATLPLYRGNCVIHAQTLRQQGYTLWRQPQARATHAPPSDLSHFFWRFLLIGHDYYWQQQLSAQTASESQSPTTTQSAADRDPTASFKAKIDIFFDRICKMVQHDRRHLFYLPFAIPIAIASILLIFVGYLITARRPDYLLQTYERVLERDGKGERIKDKG